MLDARFEGHESNKVQVVSVRVRNRNEVRGWRSSVRGDSGTFVFTMDLASCFSGLSEHAFFPLWILARMNERWGIVRLFEQLCSWWQIQGTIAIYAPCSGASSGERQRLPAEETYRIDRFREKGGGGPRRTRCIDTIYTMFDEGVTQLLVANLGKNGQLADRTTRGKRITSI